jgi:L-fucose isomerase
MAMARAAADLITARVRHACGLPVECVIADTCIGGIAEAAACEAKFEREGVGVSLTVARSWCYGYEVIDMHPTRPKAIWGFNGTERPGAVFLAAAMAAHANKKLPAFSIYGRAVQDADDFSIPPDVAERIVQFVRCGLAVATMQGKTYVSMGNVSMGIVGSLVDQDFLQRYLGMRTMTSIWWSSCGGWSAAFTTPTSSNAPTSGSSATARRARTTTRPISSLPPNRKSALGGKASRWR